MNKRTARRWLLAAVLGIFAPAAFAACTEKNDNPPERPSVDRIVERGKVLVGTTGDYRPLSYREPETGDYWGFCLDVAGEIAKAPLRPCMKNTTFNMHFNNN